MEHVEEGKNAMFDRRRGKACSALMLGMLNSIYPLLQCLS